MGMKKTCDESPEFFIAWPRKTIKNGTGDKWAALGVGLGFGGEAILARLDEGEDDLCHGILLVLGHHCHRLSPSQAEIELWRISPNTSHRLTTERNQARD